MSTPIDRARAAARRVHAGWEDIDEGMVIDHLERVAARFTDLDTQVVALLHHLHEEPGGELVITTLTSANVEKALQALRITPGEPPAVSAHRVLVSGSGHAKAVLRACADDRLAHAPAAYRHKYLFLNAQLEGVSS